MSLPEDIRERRRRGRRTALIMGVVALAVFFGFMLLVSSRG